MVGTEAGRRRARRLAMERLEPRWALDASMLRITEFVASNDGGIRDGDGDNSDWVEIYNTGSQNVDLSGMYLTDDDENLEEWQFPNGVNLAAGGYLLVFASNKDIAPPNELHASFALGADGEFLALVDKDGTTIIDQYAPEYPPQLEDISYGRAMQSAGAPTSVLIAGAASKAIVPTSGDLGLTWIQPTFDDSAWPISGPTGLGYDNNPSPVNYNPLIQTPLPGGTASAYIRVKFNITSFSDIGGLTLRMKYDDGFAAYINGEPVAESNVPEILQWDSSTGAARADSVAVQFEDFDVSSAIPHLRIGENVLAIHALNQPTGSDMLIVPELVALPPLIIVQPEMIGHFYTPTPGYGNDSNPVAGFSQEPTYSVPHGFYDTPQTVAITSATAGATIVYTTDGSTPQVDANLNVTNGTLYVNPLTISSTTTLRARAFKATYEPSFVEASSYIFINDVINQSPLGQVPAGFPPSGTNGQELNYGIDPDIINLYGAQAVKDSLKSLSTFSITTDSANLWDPSIGIYVNAGNRGDSWERPATIELIHPDGSQGFEVNSGLRIRGGYSRSDGNPKHAFRFFCADYGDAKLEYPLFGDEGVDEFDVLDLRTSQNYSWSFEGSSENTFEREVFGRDLQRKLGDPYTRSRYHHLYINGVYWGLFQTQERVEEHFAESYFGGNEEDYDVVVAGNGYTTEMSAGTDVAWRQLFNYAQQLATSPGPNANLYWTMQGLNPDGTRNEALPVLLDVDALINYCLIIFYTGGFDSGLSRFLGDNAPNNWFGVYNRVTADQGFQYFIHDNEHSLGTGGTGTGIDRTGPFNNGNQNSYAHSNPQYLHQDLMFHPEYKQRFIDKVQEYFFNGGPMMPAASIARLQARVNESDPAIIAEAARWGDSQVNPPRNKSHWQSQINYLKNTYFNVRGNIVLNQLRTDGLYTTFAAPAFSQHGGMVASGYQLSISAGTETVYYTTDGVTDPRAIGGAVNSSPAVNAYSGPITITGNTTVKARIRTAAGQWSGLVEASFTVAGQPGDFDNNNMVDNNDYLVWRANFGSTVPAGTSADATGDGMVDTADYIVWRKNVGAQGAVAQNALGTSTAVAAAEFVAVDDSVGHATGLSAGLRARFAAESATVFENWRPQRRPLIRELANGPSEAGRDLLLLAEAGRNLPPVSRATDPTHDAAANALAEAREDESAQRAYDEVFTTLADDAVSHVSA